MTQPQETSAAISTELVKLYRTPSFEKSRVGTPLASEAQVSSLMETLAADPNAGRRHHDQLGMQIRTLQIEDYRVFYLLHGNDVFLLSVDSDGPESAPTPEFKRRISRVLDRVWISAIAQAIRTLI